MDIVNFDALTAQGRIIDPSQVNPEEDYFILGKYTNHYSTNSQKYTKYPVYAIKAGDVMGGGTPTLQQVLDFNHDLVNGINLQGTGAGVGNTGNNINAFGASAAENNTGIFVNAIGISAAKGNTGNEVTAIGREAAIGNTSNFVTGIGYGAASSNTNTLVNAIGRFAAGSNSGTQVNAMGFEAARDNMGNNVIAIGDSAGNSNQADNVIAIGTAAGISNTIPGMFIISNNQLPSYADHTAAVAAISPTGIPNNTYIYHNQATMSIGAVRL